MTMIVKKQVISTTEQLNSRILIVDNNISNIIELETLVKEYGSIDIQQNPLEAKKYLNNTKYDLIIVDIDMNEMTGFEFAKLIKESFLNFLTPILFTSNNFDSEKIVKCYKYESASFIKRPFIPIVTQTQIFNILKTEALKHSIERVKENFIATLTHDLKSPINAEICALKQMLKKERINFNGKNCFF